MPATKGPRQPGYLQLLSPQGQLLSAEVFTQVGQLSNNRLVVQRNTTPPTTRYQHEHDQVGVLDGRGHWVIPYGRFRNISTFQEGIALAELDQPNAPGPARQCLIDTSGRIVAQLPPNQRVLLYNQQKYGPDPERWTVEPSYDTDFDYYTHPVFADGVARVRLGRGGQAPTSDSCELGLIDRAGRLVARYPGLR